MSPRALSVVLACLLISGCGGSEHARQGRTPGVSSAPASSPGVAGSAAPTAGAGSATAPAATSPAAPGPGSGAVNARVPATFVIIGRASVNPTSVSVPTGVAIQLTLVSGDGHAHQAALQTVPPLSLAVPAQGRVSRQLTGLSAGRYVLTIDGGSAGALVIGVAPGP